MIKYFKGLFLHTVSRTTVLVALMLGLASFCIHFPIALMLDRHDAIDPINLLFESDTGWFFESFAYGKGGVGSYGGRGIVHPNVANLVHPPIAVASKTAKLIGGAAVEMKTRHILGLAVAPLAASARTIFLFLALTTSGLNLGSALLAVALSCVSFSGILFGAIPESFGLTGAVFAFVFYLVAIFARTGKIEPLPWLLAGTLLFSITITNIVPYAILLILILYSQTPNLKYTITYAGKLVLSSIALSCILFVSLTAAHGAFGELRLGGGQIKEFNPRLLSAVWTFPNIMVRTIIPAQPHILLSDDKSNSSLDGRSVVRFTFRDDLDEIIADDKRIQSLLRGQHKPVSEFLEKFLFLFVVLLSLYNWRRIEGTIRILYLAAASQICFHWIFHSFFGKELFLYSQHWHVALIIVISMALGSKTIKVSRFFVIMLVLVAAHKSILVLRFILSVT